MSAVFALKAASRFDAGIIASLHAQSLGEEVWDQAAVSEILAMPGAFGILAWQDDRPLGFILARIASDEGEVLALGVRPRARRQGLGRRLLRAAMDRAADCDVCSLHLEVAEDNLPALGLYLAEGFRESGRRTAYYRRRQGATADALVLSLCLP